MLYGSSHNLGQRGAIPHSDIGAFRWCYVTCNNSCSHFTWNVIEIPQCCQTHVLNFTCSLWDTTSKSLLLWKILPPCPSMPCSQQDLPFPSLLSPLFLLAHARIWGSCWYHKEWLQETLYSWTFFPWKIMWLLEFIFVWNNVGKTYLNVNCTQVLSVKRDIRNSTERVQEAA